MNNFKKIISFCLLNVSKYYRNFCYPISLQYYRKRFGSKFDVLIPENLVIKESISFIFLLRDKNNNDYYFYKKRNFISDWYEIFFLKHHKLTEIEIINIFKKILPQIGVNIFPKTVIFNNIFVFYEDLNQFEKLIRLDLYLEKYKEDIKKITQVFNTIKNILIEFNKTGYIHGDIKAKNIFFNQTSYSIKIIDWDGLRKIRNHEKNLDLDKLNIVFDNYLGEQIK